jgi:autotransporter-associated beta strand protein
MNLSGGKDGASDIQLNPVKGSLILSGTIYNDSSLDYTVYGSDTGITTFLTLNTALGPNAPTQANVDFTVAGGRNTAVQVNASQVWAGTTNLQTGNFVTAPGVTLASSAIIVAGGTVGTWANTFADTASLTVNAGIIQIRGSDTVASLAGSGGVVNVVSGATLTFGGTGSTSYAGSIVNSGNLTKVGSGTFTVASASTLSGTARVTAGQLTVGAANLLADTVSVVVDGGVLSFNGSDTIGSLAGTAGTVAIGANTLTVSQSGTTTYAGAVTGNGTFTKTGSGILTLTGNAAAYAGATQVQAGTVAVNGSLGGSVDVSLGATLSGTGTIGGNASIAGTQAPGGAGVVGTQTINGNLTYAAGSILSWDLFANNASLGSYDQISVPNGDLTFSGATSVAMSFNGDGSAVAWSNSFWNVSRSWLVQDLGTGVLNNFSNLSISSQNWLDSTGAAFNTARPGSSFSVTQQGQDMLITYVVPEPSTIVALIGGLAGVAGFSIRRRRGC